MKLKKYNEESSKDDCYLIIEHDNFDNYNLFNSEKDACNFIIYILYTYFRNKKNNEELKKLDNIESIIDYDIYTVVDYYKEVENDYYDLNRISIQQITLREKFIFPDWINLRRYVKKI